jgi:hypothetical protein
LKGEFEQMVAQLGDVGIQKGEIEKMAPLDCSMELWIRVYEKGEEHCKPAENLHSCTELAAGHQEAH